MMDGNWQRLLQLWGLMSLAAGSFWLWVARHENRHRSESESVREIFVNLKSLLRIPAVQLILVMSIAGVGLASWYAGNKPDLLQLLKKVMRFPPFVALILALVTQPFELPPQAAKSSSCHSASCCSRAQGARR